MTIKGIMDEDFVNYKKPDMFIIFPTCSFKCEKESGIACCQNSDLADSPNIQVDIDNIIQRYISNPITKSIVCGGLEPFDSWSDLFELVNKFREQTNDDIVIYTGYTKTEIQREVDILSHFDNIIIKFGRFVPNNKECYSDVLGVKLSSSNQYAEKIS